MLLFSLVRASVRFRARGQRAARVRTLHVTIHALLHGLFGAALRFGCCFLFADQLRLFLGVAAAAERRKKQRHQCRKTHDLSKHRRFS